MRSPTNYKFRHYGTDPDSGQAILLWASNGRDQSIEPRANELIFRGSKDELEVIEAQVWTPNALTDEGEVDLLDVYFGSQAVRTSLYLGLVSVNPADSDGLGDITELAVASGYGRIAVARDTEWGAITAGAGTTSDTKQFAATGTWTAATDLILCTVASGTSGLLIAFSQLSTPRTLTNGDTLDVSMAISLE